MQGLLKPGALKYEDRPIWYDVMAAFPPTREPKYDRLALTQPPRTVLYPEDSIRAKFFEVYNSPGVFNLKEKNGQLVSERFVKQYQELQLQEEGAMMTKNQLFSATAELLKAQGVKL